MKYRDYLILAPMFLLGVFPPIVGVGIPMTEVTSWLWIVMIFGAAGIYTCFLKMSIFIKAFAVLSFISCFFSSGVHISFTNYIILISCIYYHCFCAYIIDWSRVKRMIVVILALNILLMTMQILGRDALCNFGLDSTYCYGMIGNSMQLKCYLFILMAFLLADVRIANKKFLYSVVFLLLVSMVVYFFIDRNYFWFKINRLPAWKETLRIGAERPWFGWGLGSFKSVWNALTVDGPHKAQGVWYSPHNDYLHILFVLGRLCFIAFTGYILSLFYRALKRKLYYPAIGLFIICMAMMFYFPLSQPQTILVIMCFFAYLETRIREGLCQPQPQM